MSQKDIPKITTTQGTLTVEVVKKACYCFNLICVNCHSNLLSCLEDISIANKQKIEVSQVPINNKRFKTYTLIIGSAF